MVAEKPLTLAEAIDFLDATARAMREDMLDVPPRKRAALEAIVVGIEEALIRLRKRRFLH